MDNRNFVVVVDDEPCVRDGVANLLAAAGYRVETFSSAEELLRAGIAGARCLILDVGLPGMSGLELHRQLAMTGCPPVIFITARDDSDGRLRASALHAGALGFLRKPFDPQELVDAVRTAYTIGGD
jgi:FixJ family two-component response regulator